MPTTYAIPDGRTVMAATIWTGDATTPRTLTNTVNGVSFQPDLVWGKNRSDLNGWHVWFDSIRGGGQIASNSTDAELSSGSNVGGYVSSYNSNGFTVTRGSNVNFTSFNASGNGFVAWQWNAGGSTVTNTSGSISAQVRANATAGFSIATFTTPASGTSSFGHGLGVTPAFVIVKGRAGGNWICEHQSTGSQYLLLNGTGAATTDSTVFNATPTSSVVNLGTGFAGTLNYVAYCFAAVAGYSAFGSYTGNGSADGPFVYLGFRPRFVLIKSSSGIESWYINDTSMNSYNVTSAILAPNTSAAEATGSWIDILSNGFKIRYNASPFNTSSGTYIYACFAENPLKYANAR